MSGIDDLVDHWRHYYGDVTPTGINRVQSGAARNDLPGLLQGFQTSISGEYHSAGALARIWAIQDLLGVPRLRDVRDYDLGARPVVGTINAPAPAAQAPALAIAGIAAALAAWWWLK